MKNCKFVNEDSRGAIKNNLQLPGGAADAFHWASPKFSFALAHVAILVYGKEQMERIGRDVDRVVREAMLDFAFYDPPIDPPIDGERKKTSVYEQKSYEMWSRFVQTGLLTRTLGGIDAFGKMLLGAFERSPQLAKKVKQMESADEVFSVLVDSEALRSAQANLDILHTFSDGMRWVDLGTGVCSWEAIKMKHCGSTDRGALISLRDEEHMPYVTMTLNQNGDVIEMLGRANTVPKKEYWSYIAGLLNEMGSKIQVLGGINTEKWSKPMLNYFSKYLNYRGGMQEMQITQRPNKENTVRLSESDIGRMKDLINSTPYNLNNHPISSVDEFIMESNVIIDEGLRDMAKNAKAWIDEKVNALMVQLYMKGAQTLGKVLRAGIKGLSPAVKLLKFIGGKLKKFQQKHPILHKIGSVFFFAMIMTVALAIAANQAQAGEPSTDYDSIIDTLKGLMHDVLVDGGTDAGVFDNMDDTPKVKAAMAKGINALESMKGGVDSMADLKNVEGEAGKAINIAMNALKGIVSSAPEELDKETVNAIVDSWEAVGKDVHSVNYSFIGHSGGSREVLQVKENTERREVIRRRISADEYHATNAEFVLKRGEGKKWNLFSIERDGPGMYGKPTKMLRGTGTLAHMAKMAREG